MNDDLIIEIMLNLTLNDILQKVITNKQWYNIISNNNFWHRLLKRDFNINKNVNCKNIYIEEYEYIITQKDIIEYSKKHNINEKYLIALIEDTKLFTKKNYKYKFNKELKVKYFNDIINNYFEIVEKGTTFQTEKKENLITLFHVKDFIYEGIFDKYILENISKGKFKNSALYISLYQKDIKNAFAELMNSKYPKIEFYTDDYFVILINPYDLILQNENLYQKFNEIFKELFNNEISNINKKKIIKNIIKLFKKKYKIVK